MANKRMDILLVEDNPMDLKLTMHALESEKIANCIEVARDGEEALDLLLCRGKHEGRRLEPPPRLVLLDLKLPKVDGLEVLRELRNNTRTKTTPVVILTSSKEEKDLIEGYRLG